MGAAVSLPFLSVFALPVLSSWGTSVNLLFFTFNWYILLLTHPPLSVEIIGIGTVQLLLYLLPGLLFLGFDTGLPSLAGAVKTHGDIALAGRHGRVKVGKIAAWSIFNVALGVALQFGIESLLTNVLHVRSAINLSKTMPMPWSIAKHVVFLLFSRGLLQYYFHRYFLHHPRSPLTKYHLSWQHSIASPFALSATYDYPPCYLIHHWAPLFLPAMLIHVHMLPLLFALTISSLETLITYSGYSILPSGIILPGMAKRVDNHFLVQGEGNYAAFGALDWVNGTSVGNDVVDDMKAEWSKHEGERKLIDAGDKAGGFMDGMGERLKGKSAAMKKRKGTAK